MGLASASQGTRELSVILLNVRMSAHTMGCATQMVHVRVTRAGLLMIAQFKRAPTTAQVKEFVPRLQFVFVRRGLRAQIAPSGRVKILALALVPVSTGHVCVQLARTIKPIARSSRASTTALETVSASIPSASVLKDGWGRTAPNQFA